MELGNMIFGHSRGEHPVDRDLQDQWYEWMRKLGFDSYGYLEHHDDSVFENETFRMQPYYWGDCECGHEKRENDFYETSPSMEQCAAFHDSHDHAPTCRMVTPNFRFKPTGFELQWYKYPLRDSYSSEPLTKELIDSMFAECERSMR